MFFGFFKIFSLAAPGLSCGTWDLRYGMFSCGIFTCSMQDLLVAACRLLVAAPGLLVAECMWDLVPRPGIEPGPPALWAQSLTHWTTGEVPKILLNSFYPFIQWFLDETICITFLTTQFSNCISLSHNYFFYHITLIILWPLLLFGITLFIYLLPWLYWLVECFTRVEKLSLFCTTISTDIVYTSVYLVHTRCAIIFLEWMNNLQVYAMGQSLYSIEGEGKGTLHLLNVFCVL